MNDNIQSLFPGAEPFNGDKLTDRLCILSDMRVRVVWDEVIYLYNKITPDGIELPEPIDSAPAINGEDYRVYVCANCGNEWDGSETFDPARAHLGKRNLFVQPFGEAI